MLLLHWKTTRRNVEVVTVQKVRGNAAIRATM
jgi:hypothetical protein